MNTLPDSNLNQGSQVFQVEPIPINMSTLHSEPSSQVSRANLTEPMIRSWSATELLAWIQENMPLALTDNDKEKFLKENITGDTLLDDPSKNTFRDAGLSLGASVGLAKLAMEIIDKKSKFHFPVTSIARLPCYKSRLLVREVSCISLHIMSVTHKHR
jgi:hypothetical protein